jgi:flagellar M-ring protein FliF
VAYIGPGVVAAVNVELDPTVKHVSEQIKIDPQGTLTTESETYSKSNDSRPAQGGRPGAQPNEVQGNEPRTLVASNQQQSTSDESRELQSTIAGHERISQTKAAFVPTMVTATVTIPRSYFRKVWKQEQIAAGTEDPGDPDDTQTTEVESRIIPQIEEQIANTLPPLEAGEDKFPLVEVGTYEDIPIEEPEPPSIATIAFTWFSDNWKTLGLFGIGVISLFILRSMLKAPAFQPPVQAPAAEISEAEEEDEEMEEEPQAMLNRKAQPSGISLREELISMVREDPDAAANVLRTWIGDAA